ncbi:MAG: DUF697 domain-containing protein [Alphaproteobacteria bacterium]|nr:DUF697 domain-containing protein [Alphaproteobacteria bacterium]
MAEQATVEQVDADVIELSRADEASAIVKRMSAWGAGAGLIPMPLVDFAAIVTVQVMMINKLSHLYDIPFSEHKVKNTVAVLIGAVLPKGLAAGTIGSFIKGIPVVGQLAGILVMPGFAAAVTWAMGRVFIQHFETGGTLLDFNAEKMRDYFKSEFEAASSKGKK